MAPTAAFVSGNNSGGSSVLSCSLLNEASVNAGVTAWNCVSAKGDKRVSCTAKACGVHNKHKYSVRAKQLSQRKINTLKSEAQRFNYAA